MNKIPSLINIKLLNKQGQSPFQHHRARSTVPWPYGPIRTGVKFEQSGRVIISAALQGVQPPLYLVQQLDPSQLQNMSMPIMLLLALVVIGLVSFILATMLVRPIRQLRNAVQIITAGDLSARVNLSGHDEVSALAKDFNLMAERINEMMNSQRQLVSDVSHELRSPLARLRIALELAERAENPASALFFH